MVDWVAYAWTGVTVAGVAACGWAWSLVRDDVSVVDSLWSLMFLGIAAQYFVMTDATGPRSVLVLALVAAWAVRLSAYITMRHLGEPEDRRYREIRANNQPGFRYKSAYIVFGLQGLLAWVIAAPLVAAIGSEAPLGWLDLAGGTLWLVGMTFETLGDTQLARFKRRPGTDGKVLDTGLWRYTRHPNYFGEFTLWWGYFLFAGAAGGWWTVYAPLSMSFLLLRVSGVTLLEKDISERRPAYREYVKRTNAFFPGPPRRVD